MTAPALVLFAKTPVPGAVKTRLMPEYDTRQVAVIAETLIQWTVQLALAHWRGRVQLSVWPETDHPLFHELCARYDLPVTRQAPGDLGRKMHAALLAWTARGIPAAVMGCDVPHLPPAVLARANHLLRRGRAVLGPSRDGGYYLIGLPRACPLVFRGMPWGNVALLSKTLRVARSANLRFTLLPALHDIDTADDLRRVSAVLPPLPEAYRQ
jgi:rSAM/selenodomain-associated transferase 1